MTVHELDWEKFCLHYWKEDSLELSMDWSFFPSLVETAFSLQKEIALSFDSMEKLEAGELVNIDEKRQVGHYWLRNPEKAPSLLQKTQIQKCIQQAENFCQSIRNATLLSSTKQAFTDVLWIGIGGSALGPQLLVDAFQGGDGLSFHFLDNTDPDGIQHTLRKIQRRLSSTLVVVVSKSGGTVETRNAMLEAKSFWKRHNVGFEKQWIVVTGEDSLLERQAKEWGVLEVFPLWDWVGGRTSIFSAVGLLVLGLLGRDIPSFLEGGKQMDELTRRKHPLENPAMKLALSWHHAGKGCGASNMVVLPYRDSLQFLGKYLQQLVMESIGKEKNLQGQTVQQGLNVFGNKGSTDQHAFVQQLRDGKKDFFVQFIEVLSSDFSSVVVEENGMTTEDYLSGFLHGTRLALLEAERSSLLLTCARWNEKTMGALLALFERTVGYYAVLIGINAYHQPGVEAGKKAAQQYIELFCLLQEHLKNHPQWFSPAELKNTLQRKEPLSFLFSLLEHGTQKSLFRKQGEKLQTTQFSWNPLYKGESST